MIKLKKLLKEIWEPTDPLVLKVAELNLPVEDNYQPIEGERIERVVWGIKKGNDIKTHDLGTLGLRGCGMGVYGIHVTSDPEYWIDRMYQDYGREKKLARVIEIICINGDMYVEDEQYVTDPETGEKASSFILLTRRNVLKYGQDWVFK